MRLKCPNCSQNTLPIIKVFFADLFGWGVRCYKCDSRLSHPAWVRYVVSILMFCVMPCTYVADMALQAFQPPGYDILHELFAPMRIVTVGVIAIMLYVFKIIQREDASNVVAVYKLRRIAAIAICGWIGLVLISGGLTGFHSSRPTYVYLLDLFLLPVFPVLFFVVISVFLQNWTL